MSARKRTTLYGAFTGDGEPVLNVWGWERRKVETLVSDRHANGEAFPYERVVRCTVAVYRAKLAAHGLPVPAELC